MDIERKFDWCMTQRVSRVRVDGRVGGRGDVMLYSDGKQGLI